MAIPIDLPTIDPGNIKRAVLVLFVLVTIVGVLLDRYDMRRKANKI